MFDLGLLLDYCMSQRFVHFAGALRSGKTALAFYLAAKLMERYNFRYILSNVYSVWNDDVSDVVLRGGRKLDAIIILDEAGQFISSAADAKKWKFAMGKLNAVLLLPTNEEVPSSLRVLQVEKTLDGYAFGLPFWRYRAALSRTSVDEEFHFNWWNPEQIFGIYDTDGLPMDANDLLDGLKKWTAEAAGHAKYETTSKRVASQTTTGQDALRSGQLPLNAQLGQYAEYMEELGGVVSDFQEAANDAKGLISFSKRAEKRKARK